MEIEIAVCKCFTLFHRCYACRISFINYFHNYFFNAPRAAQEELAGRMWPAGRRLATRALTYLLQKPAGSCIKYEGKREFRGVFHKY